MTDTSGARRRGTIGVFIGLGISALAFLGVITWAGWEPVLKALQHVQLQFVLLAFLVFMASMAARTMCWWLLLTRRVTFGRTFAALNEGYLLNNVLPWRLGELGRAILLGRQPGMSTLGVLSTIVLERTYDIILGATLLISMLPVAMNAGWAARAAWIWAGAAVVALGGLWIVSRSSARVDAWMGRHMRNPQVWQVRWRHLQSGLKVLDRPSLLVASFAFMALSWILAGLEYWLVLRAFAPAPGLAWSFLMLAATALGGAVPAAPGSLGVFEAAAVAALAVFQVPAGQALAAALVLHAMVYLVTVTLGAIALTRDGETLLGIYRDARAWLRRPSRPEAA